MVPYFFAANRPNYARWTIVYILDMLNLPQEVQRAFKTGEFVVRQIPGCFNDMWSDRGSGKAVIKDSQSSSGIVGLTRRKPHWVDADDAKTMREKTKATKKYVRQHSRGMKYVRPQSRGMKYVRPHPRGMKYVQALTRYSVKNMTNPLEPEFHPEVLINLSTGFYATMDVQNSLLNIPVFSEVQRMCFHGNCSWPSHRASANVHFPCRWYNE